MKWTMPQVDGCIRVTLIGAGGTGSMVATRLAKLAVALRKLDDGAPELKVAVYDPDTVSPANIGRQAFFEPDIGMNKAMVLVNRINLCEGLSWRAVPARWDVHEHSRGFDDLSIVITAVDTRSARLDVHDWFKHQETALWIDCGNNETTGQVVVGARRNSKTELPSVADLFPEVIDAHRDKEDTAPSCSLAEALMRQDLMVNPTIANTAVNLLWRAIRFGGLDHQGAFHDVAGLSCTPLPIDEAYWQAMGWSRKHGSRVEQRKQPVRRRTPQREAAEATT